MAHKITIGSLVADAAQAQGITVIIDVFRAFTTAAIALRNGAKQIYMVESLDSALALREQGRADICIGERQGLKPAGFDYGNSPSDLIDVRFDNQNIVQTTSNGTRGILAATNASHIYAGALVTAEATSQAIRMRLSQGEASHVSLIAMGDGDDRAVEDELCALYLRSRLADLQPSRNAIRDTIKSTSPRMDGETLTSQDIETCLNIDLVPFAIEVTKEQEHWIAKAVNRTPPLNA